MGPFYKQCVRDLKWDEDAKLKKEPHKYNFLNFLNANHIQRDLARLEKCTPVEEKGARGQKLPVTKCKITFFATAKAVDIIRKVNNNIVFHPNGLDEEAVILIEKGARQNTLPKLSNVTDAELEDAFAYHG